MKTIEQYQDEILQLIKDGKYNEARVLKDEMRKVARLERLSNTVTDNKHNRTNRKGTGDK